MLQRTRLPLKIWLRLIYWLLLIALACMAVGLWQLWRDDIPWHIGAAWLGLSAACVGLGWGILWLTSRSLLSLLGIEPTRLAHLVREIAQGQLHPAIPTMLAAPQSVISAVLVLLDKLRSNRQGEERRQWIDHGMAMINDTVRHEHTVPDLATKVCEQLRDYLGMRACGLYLFAFEVEDDSMIQRKALGLKGQSVREGLMGFPERLEQLPSELLTQWGRRGPLQNPDLPPAALHEICGAQDKDGALPRLLLVPLTFENSVRGTLILVSDTPISAPTIELITPCSVAIGVALESALNRESVLASLVDAQRLTNQLQANHEKLRQSQTALKENIRYMEDVLSSMHSGLVIVDSEGRITDCNPALLKMTGLTREQLLHQHSSLLFQEDESSLLSILKGYGQMLTRLGLQDTAAYKDLIDQNLIGCLLIDQRGRIIRANLKAATMTGYNRQALESMGLDDLVPPQMRERHRELFSMAQQDTSFHRPGSGRHLPMRTHSGEELYVDISLVNHQFEGNAVTLVLLRLDTDLPWAVINSRNLKRLVPQDDDEAMVAQLRHVDGHNTPVRINSSFLLDATGVPQKTVVNVHDVSALVLRTKEVRAQHQLLEMSMDAMQDGVLRVDREGHLVSANPMALELLGRSKSDVLDSFIDDLFPGQQHDHAIVDWLPFRFSHLMHKLVKDVYLSSEATMKLPIPLLCLNAQGYLEWATPSACDLLGIDPPPQQAPGQVRLSDETVEQLQALHSHLQPDLQTPQIVDVAWRAGTAPTMRLPTLIIPGDSPTGETNQLVWLIPEFDALCAHAIQQAHNIEWTVLHPEGLLIPVLLTASPLLDPYNRLTGAVVTFKDMRELKEKEAENLRMVQKMEQSQKLDALGQLAAGIAHDFNNLLGVIQNHAELVEMKLGEDNKATKNLAAILQATTRARDIVIKLNGLGREHPKDGTHPEDSASLFELVPVLHETQSLLQASLKGIEIEVKSDAATTGAMLKGQSGALQQVLVNLCVNASHAIGERRDGHITMETQRPQPDKVRIDVLDNGNGIPPDILPRIFEPFFTTKEVGKGTGLGLAMVRSIVTRMDGSIECHSELGKGTRFTLTLPCHAGPHDDMHWPG